jgi:peptidoglycan/xylan/chitin deacetylase (PgdA/CDA1 family)
MRPKALLLGALTSPATIKLWRRWSRGAVPILMLHRFGSNTGGAPGFSAQALRAQLSTLRQHAFRVLPLLEALDRIERGEPLERSVVLTVDDGYADFHDVALPVFAEFDCPVTVFLATGFLDGSTWLWWDRVTEALSRIGQAREAATRIEALKRLPEEERVSALDALAAESGMPVDTPPPPHCAPMTWDMVRNAGARGVTFGPHTVTHPILSRTGAQQAEREITESWRRVREETGAAIPVFCYPNGGPEDQGPREFRLVEDAGLRAAVTTIPGFASAEVLRGGVTRFAIPRFGHPSETPRLLQLASGLERAKQLLRHKLR